jgi:hypothetical protein
MASKAFLQKAYLAYFGRPADVSGLAYYADQTEAQVKAAFSSSAESQAFFGSMNLPDQINTIYNNLFNRNAEPGGLAYWSQEIGSGRVSLADAAMHILGGAANQDITAVANKLAASAAFTAALDTSPEILGYAGSEAIAPARAYLAAVDSTAGSLTTAIAGVDASVLSVINAGKIGQTFMLTADQNTVNGTNKNDTINGNTTTFTGGDAIDGKDGNDTLKIVVNESDTAYAGITVANVENIHIRSIASSDESVTLSMTDVTGVETITIEKSSGNLNLEDMQEAVDIVIDDVAGDVSIDYDVQNAPAVQNITMTEFGASANEAGASDLVIDELVETVNITDASTGAGYYNSFNATGAFTELNVTGGAIGTELFAAVDSSASVLDADFSSNASDDKIIVVDVAVNESGDADDLQDLTLKTGQKDDVVSVGGDLTEASSVDTGAGSDELLIGDIDGAVMLGEGNNVLIAGDIAGTVSAGAGDDEITSDAISGDITLGAGDNILDSDDISGSVTAGTGDNNITVDGDITGEITATDGDNFISADAIGIAGGIAPADVDPVVDTTKITLGHGDNVVIVSDEITGQAEVTFGNGQNIVLAGFSLSEDGLSFSDTEEFANDIDEDAKLTFGNGNNLVVVQNDIEGSGSLSFGTGDNTVLVGDEIKAEATITFAGGNNTVRVLEFFGEDALAIPEVETNEEAQAALIEGLTTMNGEIGGGNLNDNATITFGGEGDNTLEVANNLGSEDVTEIVDDVVVVIETTTTTVTFGNGDNTVIVGDQVFNADISFGDGNNTMTVGGDESDLNNSVVEFGNGNNELVVADSIKGADITFGNGNNVMTNDDDIQYNTVITFGNGNNTVTVGDNVAEGSTITFGAGADSLSMGSVSSIDGEGGADVSSNGEYGGTRTEIDMGAGNDTVTLFDGEGDGTVNSGATIDGGAGDDVLNYFSNDEMNELIERDQSQEFTITIDSTYAIGDVVTLVVGENTISYTVQASDFTQGITADEVKDNIAAGLYAEADSVIGYDSGDESFNIQIDGNVLTFVASNYGPDETVSINKGTLEIFQYSDASIKGFETLNLHSVEDDEGDFGDVEVDFSLVDGVSKAINMVSESDVTPTDGVPANSGNDAGHVATFNLNDLDQAESRLLSIEADEVTADGDRQAVEITIGNADDDHAIGDVITVSIGETEVEYTVTVANLNGETAAIDAKQIARSLELAIGAAATAAGFTIVASTDNTITLVGTASEDVAFAISTVSGGNGPATQVDTVTNLVTVTAADDNEVDVNVNAYLAEDADTDNDTLELTLNGRGNFDMDLSTQSWGGEDYEHIKLDVKGSFSHFIDFVDNSQPGYFEQDGTLTLTGGAAGESIYLDNVDKATVEASTSAADLTIRMVGVFDASLVVRTGSGDDTLLMQDSANELALVNLDDTINLGEGYNTLVINAQNVYNQTTLIDMEGMDRWYGDGAESYNPEPVADNAYAFADAGYDGNDDYKRAENQLDDEDFTTIRNVQKLVLGTNDQSEDLFVNQTSGEIETNTSSFEVYLDEKAHAAGIRDIVFTDNQEGSTVLSIPNINSLVEQNDWEAGNLIRVVIGNTEVTYTVHADDVSGDNQASPYNARIAQKLFEAIDAAFTENAEGNTITLVDENITITRDGANLNFGNIDDGLVFAEAIKDGDFQRVVLDSRNLEASVIEFDSAYGEGDEVSVTTYASLTDSDTDRLNILNNTDGANLTVNVRDIDIRDRESVQSYIGDFAFGPNDREFDNFQNVPVRDPREEDSGEDDYYTDFVSRVLVLGSEYSEDTINVVTTGESSLLRINGTNIDAVNVSSVEGGGYSEFVLDVNNEQWEGGPQTLTFDASALTDSAGGITLQLATVYEEFNAYEESYFDSDFLGDIIFTGNIEEEVISSFGPVSADAYIVSATNQAEVVLDVTATAGDDFVVGGKYDDVIRGELGNDILLGNGGSDTIHAGATDDEESVNILQGDLVTAENQVVKVAFGGNYDEGDVLSVTVNGNTYDTEALPANGGESEAEGDGFDTEGDPVTNDFDDANGALVVNELRDLINADFEGNSEGELTASLAMDDDEWSFDFDVEGGVGVMIEIDGRQISASGSTKTELAANLATEINRLSELDTAQDFFIAKAVATSGNLVITRAMSVSDMFQVSGIGSLVDGDVQRDDNGTNLFIVGVIAGDDLEVTADIDNTNGIADVPQVYTIASSIDMDDDGENGERTFYIVVKGQTYTYNPDESDSFDGLAEALGASDISYSNDVITITGPLNGADMPLITQAYVQNWNAVSYSASIDITDADQAADDQDTPEVTVVQDYHTVHADEQDDLHAGAGQDSFLINKSADSTDVVDALAAVDTIHNLQLGEGGDLVVFNSFVMNADPLLNIQVMVGNMNDAGYLWPLGLSGDAGMSYHSYFADATNALEIDSVVNFGGIAAMNSNAGTLAAAVNGLFAENNVFEVSGSAATNAAGLFSYGGETFLIAVGDDASASFGADDFIVKLVGVTGVLSLDNVAAQPT